MAALPQPPAAADDQVLDALLSPGSASSSLQRLGNGHLLCHTCKKASMETDLTAMAEFEARHRHHDKEDLRAPRFFAKAEPANASPSAFAAKALTERQVAAFNRFSAGAHRFDRELAVVRTLDRTAQLDAGLVHLEAAWAELEREYFELHAHIARFVAREYYSRDHTAAAVLPQNAEAAS
ncbi:hypothetical protein [Arthrobacter sp. SX1312]|uniref:hypothetical protein n=1 Tax=Arthrobacter sp. SX1312 TaxID=2058896 RepID=UPI000CE420E4|nr:hypothetical protein [Arthrobacter sp. SX1312]